MAPVWLWTPMALLVPLLTRWRSWGCTIPVLRDTGTGGPTGIQHRSCLHPGTSRVLEKGKKVC